MSKDIGRGEAKQNKPAATGVLARARRLALLVDYEHHPATPALFGQIRVFKANQQPLTLWNDEFGLHDDWLPPTCRRDHAPRLIRAAGNRVYAAAAAERRG